MKIETKNLIKKVVWNPWTALVTLAIILAVRVADPSFVESVRLRYFDQLVTSQPAQDIPVSVVNIDEATLDKLGQFPFPRGDYADIIQDLYQHDAGLVVFNVLMPEKDRFKQDAILGRTMQAFPTVLPAVAGQKNKNTSHGSPVQKVGQDAEGKVVAYPGLLSNVEPQSSIAAGIGIVNTFPEIDGVVRRMPLVIMVGDELYPSLAMETLRVAAGDTRIQVKIGDVGVEALRVPKLDRINTDSLSRVWIDWSATPKEYSYTELPKSFNKGVVIVGLSAAGLANPVATAKGEVWPQYLQAATLGTMLTGKTIQRPDWADNAELLALAVLGIALLFLTRWTYVGLLSGVIAIGILYPISQYLYSNYLWLVDITAISVGVVLVLLHAYGVKFVSEFLQKQQIKKQFGSYLSPDLVAKLQKNPELLVLGGEEQELSIMFTDVRGFTSISEFYGKDVQGLTKIMNRYMTAMTKTILENDGTLDKYIGDAQMAFWNAPLDNTKHCKDSVKAALEMLGSLDGFNKEIAEEGTPPFGMGIGINTGDVVVGNMGSEQRFDYTCLGDAVNLASRLEGQSKNYGILIVLGPITAERVGDEYFVLPLDCIAVKGKKEGVNISTVFYNPPLEQQPVWEHDKEVHELMLEYYRKQEWNKAIALVDTLKGKFDGQMDHYYDLWLERIEEMKAANLAADWDGVFRATSK
jgi:adenylate cyclase